MKILSAAQIRAADQATIVKEPISSLDLMERAAERCANRILKEPYDREQTVDVICGVGNNGGDGLVIARKFLEHGLSVRTIVLCFSENRSDDFKANLSRLRAMNASIAEIHGIGDLPELTGSGWIIDAIFGSGLKRAPAGWLKEVIQRMNHSRARTISVDLPSGLFSDGPVEDPEAVVAAELTLTFQQPKMAFLLPDNQRYVRKWEVIDIGLDHEFINGLNDCPELIDLMLARSLFRNRSRFEHKGDHGHSLLVGGSFGKIGAVVLAVRGALRAGSGLVSAYVPKCGYSILQTAVPEAMVEVDDEQRIRFFNFKVRPDAIGIGPGMGTHLKTKEGFVAFLKRIDQPLVLDADALNIIAEHEEIAELIPEGSILTPHPGEFKRLVGPWRNDHDKMKKQQDFAARYDCIVVLKGAYTSVAGGGGLYFNSTGNPGMGTGGSGDVLTGVITGLLAQGYDPIQASVLGVYLHGRAADLAVMEDESPESLVASDLIDHMGHAFKELGSVA